MVQQNILVKFETKIPITPLKLIVDRLHAKNVVSSVHRTDTRFRPVLRANCAGFITRVTQQVLHVEQELL
jgi:hypothetical protein